MAFAGRAPDFFRKHSSQKAAKEEVNSSSQWDETKQQTGVPHTPTPPRLMRICAMSGQSRPAQNMGNHEEAKTSAHRALIELKHLRWFIM
ncbi:hypothetical protein AAFF_G00031560 [Aldrovandia affinis]|uniref:Uncharacterized protein n=1 Tax=Aldrovandia affinis TaxID=143900 RepID=A0AAD7S439_9TELE|nr:hypothetical protein AAFF_G00031560 [Aldrovandia affinis]